MENYNPRQFITRLTGAVLHEAVFHFKAHDSRALLALVHEHVADLPAATAEAFIDALEHAIARYTTLQALEKEKIRETALRDNIKELDAAADTLQTTLDKFADQDNRFVLELCLRYILTPPVPVSAPSTEEEVLAQIKETRRHDAAASEFIDDFAQRLNTLCQAIALAQEIKLNTKSGPKKDQQRQVLATDVAGLFQSYLGLTPTTTQKGDFTEEGLFTRVLRIVLCAVGIETQDLHRLVGQAVKQVKSAAS